MSSAGSRFQREPASPFLDILTITLYTKHTTEALVLSSWNSGEANRVYTLLTSDFGKVHARAHGVRDMKSRHRHALQTLSHVDVSLVRGKTGWKITNVSPKRSFWTLLASEKEKLALLSRIANLTKRLVAGEGGSHSVFEIFSGLATALANTPYTKEELPRVEVTTLLRLLHTLGYLKKDEGYELFLQNYTDLSNETIARIAPMERRAIVDVNAALSASHL